MAYSKSVSTLRKIEADLYPLAEGRPARWTVDDAATWAYKVREGLSIARDNPELFPALARHAERFIIEVLDKTTVQARVKLSAAHSTGLESHGRNPLTVIGANTSAEVIQHWIKCQPTKDPIHFPECNLTEADLAEVVRWANNLRPKWSVMRPKGTSVLTLTPYNKHYPSGAVLQPLPEPVEAEETFHDVENLPDSPGDSTEQG